MFDRTLVVVDVQNDFCEGGSLPVAGGTEVAEKIANYLISGAYIHTYVVATRDYHIDPGSHFSTVPDFRNSWPKHCLAGSHGADFHPVLLAKDETGFCPGSVFSAIFDKGHYSSAYSGFEGMSAVAESLEHFLLTRSTPAVDICGIALDYCVKATALDAVKLGFEATVFTDLTVGVDPVTSDQALTDMRDAGVTLTTSS